MACSRSRWRFSSLGIEKVLGLAVAKANTGMLEFQRTLERIRNCGILKQAKQAEIAAAISGH